MNSATAVATFSGRRESWLAHADVRQGAGASQHRSRGSGTTEQVSESAPELLLVNARLVLALVSALACGVTAFSSITTPPCRRLRRLQFVQALPLLGGDQDYRAMARPDQSDRPVASLHFAGDCLQVLGVADWLLSTPPSMWDIRKVRRRPPVDVRLGDVQVSTSHLAERTISCPWTWPYIDPRTPGKPRGNAGEYRQRRPRKPAGHGLEEGYRTPGSGTLTRKRSLVQIQYGPRL